MNAPVTSIPVTSIQVQKGTEPNPVIVKGEGTPLVYLHGLLGQDWGGFHDQLAKSHRVYAPAHVGTSEAEELQLFDGFHDLVLYYDELFDRLGLTEFDLIGHSFGGMVAAEYAALFRHRVRRLVLINPLGLWRDDKPVSDYLLLPADRQNALLIGDPANEGVQAMTAPPLDPQLMMQQMLNRMMAIAGASHFIWPIPERGLAKRLYRITAKTLIVWGEDDKFVPAVYARDFASAIASSTVEMIAKAGHSPQVEQQALVAQRVVSFLA